MSITLKEISLNDLDEVMDWRMEVLSVVFSPKFLNSKELYQQNLTYYKRALSDGSHYGVFALENGKIIGCGGICFYQEMPSPDNINGRCGYLMNIYVRETYRHHGVGELIIRDLIREAKKRETNKIYLETTEKGLPLYKKLGFTPMQGYLKL